MTITDLRERAAGALLHAGTELAFDQQAMERSLAAAPSREVVYSGAQGAVTMARWVDSALLWLGMRVQPRAVARRFAPPPTAA
jgi:hypothetical protein